MILNDLRTSITDILNQSGLSIEIIYFVIKDIMNEVTDIYTQQLQSEQQNAAAAQESKEEVQKEQAAPSADIIEKEEN